MSTRDDLIRAMHHPTGTWTQEAQELNLLLHDLAADPPAGWMMAYEICDDDSGHNPRNRDLFAGERRSAWYARLTRLYEKYGDDDDLADRDAIPQTGHHALIVLKHTETGAEVRRWVDREQLAAIVRQPNRTPAQRLAAAARVHVDTALVEGEARVARKRQRLEAGGAGRRER